MNEKILAFIKNYWEGQRIKVERSSAAGSSIDAWNTDYLPPEEWALGIFEDAQKIAKVVPTIVRRYDSPRKVTVPIQVITTSDWSSTVAQDVTTATVGGSTKYHATGKVLDPVEYRTFMPIARKLLDEATWSVEADVRNRLAVRTALKLDELAWASLDGTALSSGNYQTAGESLTNTTTANAVDYGAGATVDTLINAIYNVRSTSYNFYIPNTGIITAGIAKELMKDSAILNSSENGSRAMIQNGVIQGIFGLDLIIAGNVPQDSGSTDIGLIYDKNYYFIANIPIDYEIAPELYRPTDEVRFFVKCKAAFSVGDPESGAVLYT